MRMIYKSETQHRLKRQRPISFHVLQSVAESSGRRSSQPRTHCLEMPFETQSSELDLIIQHCDKGVLIT